MAKGFSLHIGLNNINPKFYKGDSGELSSCENDAKAFFKITQKLQFANSKLLLSSKATIDSFLQSFDFILRKSVPEDFIFLTFSGHGGWLRDLNNDEIDGWDETWCFFDGQLLDDKIHQLLSQFPKKQRIFIISDSCHSGSITKNDSFLSNKLTFPKKKQKTNLSASVRLFAACQDEEYAIDGKKHGLFTQKILDVWNEGTFQGNYASFFSAIESQMPPFMQNPNHLKIGTQNPYFDKSLPFIF